MHTGRSSRAITSTQHVGADDKKTIGIQRLVRTHKLLPPAFGRVALGRRRMTRSRQAGMQQDRIRSVRIQLAPRFVRQIKLGQFSSVIQLERMCMVVDLIPRNHFGV